MSPYRVIIIGAKGPELLGGFDDRGQCRRAWSTATKGAAILNRIGILLEHKSGTTRAAEKVLERYADQLARGDAAAAAVEAPAPVVEAPKTYRATKPARADCCESCDAVLPDHLAVCPLASQPPPVVPDVALEEPPAPKCPVANCTSLRASVTPRTKPWAVDLCTLHRKRAWDVIDQQRATPEGLVAYLSGERHPALLEPAPETPAATTVAAVVDEASVQPIEVEAPPSEPLVAAVDEAATAAPAIDCDRCDFTLPNHRQGCPLDTAVEAPWQPEALAVEASALVDEPFGGRVLEQERHEAFEESQRELAAETAALVDDVADASFAPFVDETVCEVSAPPCVVEAEPATARAPISLDELMEAAAECFNVSPDDCAVWVNGTSAVIAYMGNPRVKVTRERGDDPLALLATELWSECSNLTDLRDRVVRAAELELERALARRAQAVRLGERLRAAGQRAG